MCRDGETVGRSPDGGTPLDAEDDHAWWEVARVIGGAGWYARPGGAPQGLVGTEREGFERSNALARGRPGQRPRRGIARRQPGATREQQHNRLNERVLTP